LTRENGYLLEVHDVWLDTEVFNSRIGLAGSAYRYGDLEQAKIQYGAALEIYQGEYLSDVDLDWAVTEREWLRSRALYAIKFLVHEYLNSQDYLAVIDGCRQIIKIDPLEEEAYRILVRVHGKLGQLSQVRRWYELCVRRLRDELQISPDPSTVEVFKKAMNGGLVGTRMGLAYGSA
jgi:two-component SAPR family response regulator